MLPVDKVNNLKRHNTHKASNHFWRAPATLALLKTVHPIKSYTYHNYDQNNKPDNIKLFNEGFNDLKKCIFTLSSTKYVTPYRLARRVCARRDERLHEIKRSYFFHSESLMMVL